MICFTVCFLSLLSSFFAFSSFAISIILNSLALLFVISSLFAQLFKDFFTLISPLLAIISRLFAIISPLFATISPLFATISPLFAIISLIFIL